MVGKAVVVFITGVGILIVAVLLNLVAKKLDISTWYDFIKTPRRAGIVSYIWLFIVYPMSLGLAAYLTIYYIAPTS